MWEETGEPRENPRLSAGRVLMCNQMFDTGLEATTSVVGGRRLSPFSTRRLFSREATFSFVGVANHVSKCDADKGKSRFARKKSPSGKRALDNWATTLFSDVITMCL